MKLEEADKPARLTITLPAGKYYIGDPCYVVPSHLWMNFIELGDFRNTNPDHIVAAKFDGHTAIGISTANGDGNYLDQFGNEYGVDSGMIGAVPKRLFDLDDFNKTLVHEIMFDKPFRCYFRDGNIHFGTLTIGTDEEDWNSERPGDWDTDEG